jgi:hypothetical protein
MRPWINRPIPVCPLVEKLLEFTGIWSAFPIKGRLAMNTQPKAYVEKNSQKPGKIALKRTFPTFGPAPLGRSRPPANGQSPLQAESSVVRLPTPPRGAQRTTPCSPWTTSLLPPLCPQNTATPPSSRSLHEPIHLAIHMRFSDSYPTPTTEQDADQ